jgi:hypothetical protein
MIRFLVALGVCVLGARFSQRDAIEARRRLSALPPGTPATTVDSASAADVRQNAAHASYLYNLTIIVLAVAFLLGVIDGLTALILFIWPGREAEPPFQSLVPPDRPE